MQANYVKYNEFDPSKLIVDSPVQKQIPRSQPPNYYRETAIQYNYGTPEQPRIGSLLVEWPEIFANGGISIKDEQGGRKSYSIYVQLPEEGETGELVKQEDLLYMSIATQIAKIKGQIGMPGFMPFIPGPNGQQQFNKQSASALLRPIITYPTDKLSGEVIPGKAPRAYLKLMKRGFGAAEEKTLFTDLSANPIHWDLLSGVEMKFIPVIHYEKVYIGGGKASIQAKVQSAVVTYLVGKNTQTCQTMTIQRLVQERPDAANTLAEQIARLTMDRQAALMSSGVPSQPTGAVQAITQDSIPSTSGLSDFLNSNPMSGGLPQIPMTPSMAPSSSRSMDMNMMSINPSMGSIKFQ